MKRSLGLIYVIALLSALGCQKAPSPEFRFNAVELKKQERLTLPYGSHFPLDYQIEIRVILEALFGTPDKPRFPEFALPSSDAVAVEPRTVSEDLLDSKDSAIRPPLFRLSNLEIAAGAVRSDENGKSFGLYREHCANCHGLTGDGAGATAGFLDPYPRDFRLAKFKFKSTPLRQAPTHQDMLTLLRNGIPGTAMPSFSRLPLEELEALIDYVRYLSARGQVERYLISELARMDDGPMLSEKIETPIEDLTTTELDAIAGEAMHLIGQDVFDSFVGRWLDAESKVTVVSLPPGGITEDHSDNEPWVKQGRELYFGKGNCAECHGELATGIVATKYYDDWTNDWIKSSGVDLLNRSSYRDFLKAGALPPRSVRPRNLKLAVMRGGERAEDVYRKIANGIEGTPMPSSAATLKEEEIWALVAYVKSLGSSTLESQKSEN